MCKEKPQPRYANVVDIAVSLVEVISLSLRCLMSQGVFQGDTDASSFTDVELNASGTMNYVYSVVRQAVELFRDVHLELRASNVGVGTYDRTCSTCCLIAWCGP